MTISDTPRNEKYVIMKKKRKQNKYKDIQSDIQHEPEYKMVVKGIHKNPQRKI